ncbi:hypothetical protein [Streptomyces leeuwenhoekii]|uniref:Secreted Protein n=1 Tax=Streptomyces leeuwenhoekii TaxID=1437453 RepID=A0A0F7VYB9_STRLW|nr:hypothetical protein [Streptomyces leeuwenhoekii]CQR61806.1 Hypothetical Protein SCAB [Streptomyces leeuwenhoekii]
MRVRVATTAVGITAVVLLTLPACPDTTDTGRPAPSSSARSGSPAATEQSDTPLSSAALAARLLDESDLGSGYTRKPERPAQHDDVTVLGCPALADLGDDAATGGQLDFPRQAKATFLYSDGSNSEVSEELYSDTAETLSVGSRKIFDAMVGCPHYPVLVGGTAFDMTTQEVAVPQLGTEQWSQLLTYSAAGRETVVKQTAVRDGNMLLVVSGSPALVDRHLDKALTRAAAVR